MDGWRGCCRCFDSGADGDLFTCSSGVYTGVGVMNVMATYNQAVLPLEARPLLAVSSLARDSSPRGRC